MKVALILAPGGAPGLAEAACGPAADAVRPADVVFLATPSGPTAASSRSTSADSSRHFTSST
jgi:hypothetical protein